jgi:hypothetical protein
MITEVCVIRTTRGGRDPDYYIAVVDPETFGRLDQEDVWRDPDLIEKGKLHEGFFSDDEELAGWLYNNDMTEVDSVDAEGY